ncbi:MAG: hypothetical protein WD432_00070 [Candidatus Saccharimonadales bacterium]
MSKLKVVSIQHPDAVNPSIQLSADGSISIDKVPAGDVDVTPTGGITAENVQAALEELDTNKATTQHVDTLDPFKILNAEYASGSDTITITIGEGRVDWGSGVTTEFTSDETVEQTPVSTGTTYYVFLNDDDSLSVSTTATPKSRQVRLGSVTTGATKDDLTIADLRGILPVPSKTESYAHTLMLMGA